MALFAQGLFQRGGKGLVGGKPIAGGEAVAERDDAQGARRG